MASKMRGGSYLQSISPAPAGTGGVGHSSWNVGGYDGRVASGSPGTAALMAGGRSRRRRGRSRRGRSRKSRGSRRR
jgi:hypothetical protein